MSSKDLPVYRNFLKKYITLNNCVRLGVRGILATVGLFASGISLMVALETVHAAWAGRWLALLVMPLFLLFGLGMAVGVYQIIRYWTVESVKLFCLLSTFVVFGQLDKMVDKGGESFLYDPLFFPVPLLILIFPFAFYFGSKRFIFWSTGLEEPPRPKKVGGGGPYNRPLEEGLGGAALVVNDAPPVELPGERLVVGVLIAIPVLVLGFFLYLLL